MDQKLSEMHGPGGLDRLCDRLRQLYHGRSPVAVRFQFAIIVVDLLIVAFFIATPLIRDRPVFLWADYAIATIVAVEITARLLAASSALRLLRQPSMVLDLFILATLLAPQWLENFGFLRILRLWSFSQRDLALRCRWQSPPHSIARSGVNAEGATPSVPSTWPRCRRLTHHPLCNIRRHGLHL
ncbi:ion transporter [Bosea vaviloviae]|uniref:Ion transport domain-containing protein n=1 Tax=Bosea vaviloviae TaxID=1526658 RepID=A0A1D7U7D3_9HYPH|nr:ion transporter [Bosea vaviloviae]AOO83272.1 hypothetical protein BHK69_25000 [Bosea vaviloviae]